MNRSLVTCLAVSLCIATLSACGGLTDQRAIELVEAYNQRLTEAFRTADPMLVEGVAGPDEAKKLTGLIGVKQDQGITLDSALLTFEVLGTERPSRNEIVVATAETWYYLDRRIGSGKPVGEDSTDHYLMKYHLRRLEQGWRVAEVRFAAPPQVGRSEVPDHAPAGVLHGVAEQPMAGATPVIPEPPSTDRTGGDQP